MRTATTFWMMTIMKLTREDLQQIIKEELEAVLDEKCQKGYKTHEKRKTKKMFGKTVNNCVKKEEVEIDEVWYDTVVAKVDQMTHPKGYEKMVIDYAKLMRQDKYKKHPNSAAAEVARGTRNVNTRQFIRYINRLAAKKILPKNLTVDLKAEYQTEDLSFKNFVDQLSFITCLPLFLKQ